MIEDTIAKIEERLRTAQHLPSSERAELEDLLAQLRRETASLPSVSEQFRDEDEDVHTTLGRLEESLTEFETTHPQLVGIVNRISTILANMGI
jgi:chromosome segregation ATPase